MPLDSLARRPRVGLARRSASGSTGSTATSASTPGSSSGTRPCAASPWATPPSANPLPRSRSRRWSGSSTTRWRRARSASRRRSARRTPTATATPSRHARSSHDELLALAAAVREHPGTTLEFIAAMGEIARRPDRADDRHVARRQPAAQLEPARQPVADRGVRAAADVVRLRRPTHGARVVALDAPRPHAHAGPPRARRSPRLARDRRAPGRRAAPSSPRSRCPPPAARRRRRGHPPRARRHDRLGAPRDRRGARGRRARGRRPRRPLDRGHRTGAWDRPRRRAHRRRAPRPPPADARLPVARPVTRPDRRELAGAGGGLGRRPHGARRLGRRRARRPHVPRELHDRRCSASRSASAAS